LFMTFDNGPVALNLSLQRQYAERCDWLLAQFKSWAFSFIGTYLFYKDYDRMNEDQRNFHRRGMAAYGGIMPTYRIGLFDEKPTILWDFYSLSLGIELVLSLMITDEKNPLCLCRQCDSAFLGKRVNSKFCSLKCKNQYHAAKHRSKEK